jgi:pimeloyl-ACP methyl ester carboxylesterase
VGLLFLYWVEVPIMLALVATHRPAAATEAGDLGRPAQQVTVPTMDGLDLSASWVPSGNGAAVVTFPDRSWTEVQSRMLADAGYGVLALDMRGYGDSEGDPDAFGWGSAADIDAGVAWLRDRQGIDRIAGLGLSVGGEQMIEAAASNPDLAAAVAEGPGERSVKETLLFGAAGLPALPHAFVMTAATAIFSGDAPPPALDDSAAAISPRGLFVITAENGQGGEELGRDYYDAAAPPRRFWEVPGADHTGGIVAAPGEYRRRVLTFFGRTLDTRAKRPDKQPGPGPPAEARIRRSVWPYPPVIGACTAHRRSGVATD